MGGGSQAAPGDHLEFYAHEVFAHDAGAIREFLAMGRKHLAVMTALDSETHGEMGELLREMAEDADPEISGPIRKQLVLDRESVIRTPRVSRLAGQELAMALMSQPKQFPMYPPAGYQSTHRVKNGDSWVSLAQLYYRQDPWDIIQFNFGTKDPREVNWFLAKYVGSKTETPDGKNLRFSAADSPGIIYIPPKEWKPGAAPAKEPVTEHEDLRRDVLNVLADPRLHRVSFSYHGLSFHSGRFHGVANDIIDRKIRVTADTSLDHGEYDHELDLFAFPWTSAKTLTRQALVVHEAVHASLDKRSAGWKVFQSETAAYLAQMLYAYVVSGSGLTANDTSTTAGADTQQVYYVAFVIVEEMAKGKKLSELSLEVAALEQAVCRHTWYRGNAYSPAGFNGT